MTLTIRLELSPETQAELQNRLVHHDKEQVYRLLTEALEPTVEAWLQHPPDLPGDNEFEALVDQFAATLAASISSATPVLSDEAVSRAAIYEEHP